MPLFLCPNDNTAMQVVKRGDVELDICPQCRGVWLDRGELEKILQAGREDRQEQEQAREAFTRDVDQFRRDPDDWRRRHPYDEAKKQYRYDDDHHYGHRKKKRGFDLFDIFD